VPIEAQELATDSVATAKIVDHAVTRDKLAQDVAITDMEYYLQNHPHKTEDDYFLEYGNVLPVPNLVLDTETRTNEKYQGKWVYNYLYYFGYGAAANTIASRDLPSVVGDDYDHVEIDQNKSWATKTVADGGRDRIWPASTYDSDASYVTSTGKVEVWGQSSYTLVKFYLCLRYTKASEEADNTPSFVARDRDVTKGDTGPQGVPGPSAYQGAVAQGYQGTENQYLSGNIGFGVTMVPDYANMETTSRLSGVNNSSWQVDRDGYVQLRIQTVTNGNYRIYINDSFTTDVERAILQGMGNNREVGVFPVKAGDVLRVEVHTAQESVSAAQSVVCHFIPPKYIFTRANTASEHLQNVVVNCTPDYANVETTNRISANNGTWTVDRDGYVVCGMGGTSVNSGSVSVNDVKVARIYSTGGSTLGAALLAVKTGDIVKITSPYSPGETAAPAHGISCYFIPPKYTLAGVVIEPQKEITGLFDPSALTIDQITALKTALGIN
jgi:hypothetical protein